MNKEYKRGIFMKLFCSNHIAEIKKFCYRINNANADIFIVMARKAVCFIYALFEMGYLNKDLFNKIVISDRALDMNGLDFANKKIEIVDDIIISGSTIGKTINKLIDMGCMEENIHVTILAINNQTCKMRFERSDKSKFLDREQCYKISEEQCIDLSSTIVKAVICTGITYDIDFPSYEFTICHIDILQKIINSANWDFYRNTNNIYNKSDMDFYSLIPTNMFKDKIDKYIGIKVSEISQIKLHLYVCGIKDSQMIKVQPVVELYELEYSTINCIFEDVISLSNIDVEDVSSIRDTFKSEISKLRLLHYYVAYKVGKLFFDMFNFDSPIIMSNTLDFLFVDSLCVQHLLESHIECSSIIEIVPNDKIETFNYTYDNNTEYNIFDILIDPFKKKYFDEEITARKDLADETLNVLDRQRLFSYDRLERGYSFRALCRILANSLAGIYRIKESITMFIDRAVTYGMIVPIFFDNGESICIAYRYGEDFIFSEQDQNCLKYYLKQLFNMVDGNEIAAIPTEKLIVLFLQMGILPGYEFLNGFKNFDQAVELLTVKYCVHGAVAEVITDNNVEALHPYVTKNPYSEWLTERFKNEGILVEQKKPNKNHKIIKYCYEKEINLSDSSKGKIDEIALLLSKWYNISKRNGKISEFTKKIVAITSCVTEESFVSAIIAELHISMLDWNSTIKPAIEKNNFYDVKKAVLSSRKNEGRMAFTAMNSARMKYKWFRAGTMHMEKQGDAEYYDIKNVISDVKDLFKKYDDSGFASVVWNRIWSTYLETEAAETDISKYIPDCVRYAYVYNIIYRILEYITLTESTKKESKAPTIANLERLANKSKEEVYALLQEYAELAGTEEDIKYFYGLIDNNDLFFDKLGSIKLYINERNKYAKIRINIIERYFYEMRSIKKKNTYTHIIVADLTPNTSKRIIDKIENYILSAFPGVSIGTLLYDNNYVKNGNYQYVIMIDGSDAGHTSDNISISIIGELAKLNANRIIVIKNLSRFKYAFETWGNNNIIKVKMYTDFINRINNNIKSKDIHSKVVLVEHKGEEQITTPIKTAFLPIVQRITGQCNKNIENVVENYKETIELLEMDKREEYDMYGYSDMSKSIGIITIIPCEAQAVIKEFDLRRIIKPKTQRTFYEGFCEDNNNRFNIYMTRQIDSGNIEAAMAYKALNEEYKLDYIVYVGIAGTMNIDNASICDVLIPKKVIDLVKAKEKNGDIQPEANAVPLNSHVVRVINDFFTEHKDEKFIAKNNIRKSNFMCDDDPISSNGHVISDQNAEMKKESKRIDRKSTGIDTESAGALYGAYISDLDTTNACNNLMIIRGISDDSTNKPGDDKWHQQAASNAAQVLRVMLSYM